MDTENQRVLAETRHAVARLKREVEELSKALLQVQKTLVNSFASQNASINAHTQAIDTHTAQLFALTPVTQATVARLQDDPNFAMLLKRILIELSANQNASTIPDSTLERNEQYLRRIVPGHLLP